MNDAIKLEVTSPEDEPNFNLYGSSVKTHVPIQKEVDKGKLNFNANLLNRGKDDSIQQKASRMAAMKRRLSHRY